MNILKFPLSANESSSVLVSVTPSSTSSQSLNAKLVATEGSAPFVLHLKPATVEKSHSSKSPISSEEYSGLLTSVLLHSLIPDDLEIRATVEEETSLTLTFRRTYSGGLKTRLGSLVLKYDEDQEIELFDWCVTLAFQATGFTHRLEEGRRKLEAMQKQNEDLMKAKGEAESELLGKCMRLVNSKKARIGQLEERLRRLGGGGGVMEMDVDVEEPKKDEEEEEEDEPPKKTKGKAASKGKGKAKAKSASPPKKLANRSRKRAAPEPEPEPEEEEDADDDEDIDTEADVETESEQSDHSVEDEVPEIKTRASPSQEREQRKEITPPKVDESPKEDEGESHVKTRAQSQREKTPQKGKRTDAGSETETDDEL